MKYPKQVASKDDPEKWQTQYTISHKAKWIKKIPPEKSKIKPRL